MATRPPGLRSILIAVAFALSVFGFSLFVWMSFGGEIPLKPKGYRVNVLFASEAAQLSTGADVRIAGVRVGDVKSIDRSIRGTDAVIQLDPEFAPLEADSRAIIRFKTLLGESFVELTPGTREGPELPENGRLPTAQVQPVETVDEVLGAFDEPTRRDFRVFLGDLSGALDERGPDVNSAIGNAAPTVEELQALVELLDRQEPAVRGLVRDGGIALGSVARRGRDVRRLVVAGNRVLGTTAARNRGLTATVDELPPLLREMRKALVEIDKTSQDAAPTLRALRPVAPLVRPGLEATNQLAPELHGLFRELDPVLESAQDGLPAAQRVVESARPLMRILDPAVRELVPVVQLIESYKLDLVTALAKVAAATEGTYKRGDGSQVHILRVLAPLTNELLVGYAERLPTNRHNPYLKPGGLEGMAGAGLKAFDCENTGNSSVGGLLSPGAPPCMTQRPWVFEDDRRAFPHAERWEP